MAWFDAIKVMWFYAIDKIIFYHTYKSNTINCATNQDIFKFLFMPNYSTNIPFGTIDLNL